MEKEERLAMKKNTIGGLGKIGILLLFVLIIAGCFSRSKPAYTIDRYMFEYTPPAIGGLIALAESIKVELFFVNQSFNTRSMVYKPHPFKFMTYNYSQWRVNPADMVTDYLLRDLRNTNIFQAVFSHHDIEKTRFIIEGQIEDFLETADKNDVNAILSVNITLLDTYRKEINKRIVFQKQYKFQEKIREHAPEEFAKGMSINMSRLSEQLVKDFHKAIMAATDLASSGQPGIKPDTTTR
ncbi:MAG: ABC-type transport auxiliary lipoprotein family protein [Proteobacteria bacterium]|nr:ABC-type transport auxiliary lipoprotein family protein [Pseudomonadota bacterium]